MARATSVFYGLIVVLASIAAIYLILEHAQMRIIEEHQHHWVGFAPFLTLSVIGVLSGTWLTVNGLFSKRRVY